MLISTSPLFHVTMSILSLSPHNSYIGVTGKDEKKRRRKESSTRESQAIYISGKARTKNAESISAVEVNNRKQGIKRSSSGSDDVWMRKVVRSLPQCET
jgi:hypothetical protein